MYDPLVEQTRAQVTEDLNYRDGITQIAVSAFIFFSVLMAMANTPSSFVIFIPILPGLMESLRKRFTYPRVGYAKIKQNKEGSQAILWVLIALALGAGVAFFSRGRIRFVLPSMPQFYYLMSFSVAIPVLLIGFFMFSHRRKRMPFMIGVVMLCLVALLLFRPQRHLIFIMVLSIAAVNLLIGIVRLRAFTHYYPVLRDE